ncbi:MAG: alanine racemase [Myxococcota bacterium]|nr:alanine racemase [Myxococcota bacterium]
MSGTDTGIDCANCWIEIDRAALISNVQQLKAMLDPPSRFMAVVKANAYGHGMAEVAAIALRAGADWLGVFSPGEGLALRQAGMDTPILVFGPTPAVQLRDVLRADLRVTVASMQAAKAVASAAALTGAAAIHLKVETGTNRQGLTPEEITPATRLLAESGVRVEGIYTHFADIEDTTDHSFALAQLARFRDILARFAEDGWTVSVPHTACSAATLLFPSTHFNLVRVGIALYGLWPSKETYVSAKSLGRNAIALKPVMTWKTRIAQIKAVDAGEFVGYGRTFRVTRPSCLAVLPVGYADGYDRRLSNLSHVLINGKRAPVRGRICMNLTMVDITDIPEAAVNDPVVLLGQQGEEAVTAEDLARLAGTINYEIVTRAAPHAPRVIVG